MAKRLQHDGKAKTPKDEGVYLFKREPIYGMTKQCLVDINVEISYIRYVQVVFIRKLDVLCCFCIATQAYMYIVFLKAQLIIMYL